MGEGTTKTAVWRRRSTLIGAVVAFVIVGLGVAQPALAIGPNDAAYKDTRAMVTVAGCNGVHVSMEAREREELNLHNARRREIGAPQLCIDPALQRAAEAYAQDMIKRSYFSHTSPEGTTPSQRAKAVGYSGQTIGENLANTPAEYTATQLMQLWMNSAGHRSNIEYKAYVHVGMASADTPAVDDDPNDGYPAWVSSSKHVALFGGGGPAPDNSGEIPVEPDPAPAPAPTPAPAPAPASAPAMPEVTNLKPALGSTTTDRTPLAVAMVKASNWNVTTSHVKVSVDGKLVRFGYSASTDRMRAILPSLRPGKHTIKVTVSGGPRLAVEGATFTVK